MKNSILYFSAISLLFGFSTSKEVEKSDGIPDKTSLKPNILFIFTDDQCYSTIHALGNNKIKTPNMDKLVNSGTSFTNAYIMGGSSPAVCSPSRASLFSGLTLWNLENQGIYGFEISEKYTTLPQVFRENGYNTFATGKNEPGREGHFARSFSSGDKILFRGMTGSQYRLPLSPFSADGDYSKEKEVIHEGKHSAEVYASACIRFLEEQADNEQPFFAWVAFQTPHDPRQAPDSFREMYKDEEMELPASFLPEHPFDNGMLKIRDENLAGFPRTPEEVRKQIADYYAMISHDDYQVGRILEALKKSGKYDNTIIVFASDNGLAMGKHGLMGKQNVYEHSVHVPLIISGPGIPKGELLDQLCYLYDIYPTLCERAGLPVPETVQFKSLNKVIQGEADVHREYLSFAFMSWQRALRDERFKLIEYCVDGSRFTQLFDLEKDPDEMKNLAGNPEYDQQLNSMRTLLELERVKLNDGNTPFEFTRKQGEEFWNTYNSVEKSGFPKFYFQN
jgi:arylsulfatase A-like enzyme